MIIAAFSRIDKNIKKGSKNYKFDMNPVSWT